MQTVWGDDQRFIDTYYTKFNKDPESKDWRDWPYMTGDGGIQAADGYLRVVGRLDDVINVAGHRLGTKELESATLTVEAVTEGGCRARIRRAQGQVSRDVRLHSCGP